jgi:hypothetical protein
MRNIDVAFLVYAFLGCGAYILTLTTYRVVKFRLWVKSNYSISLTKSEQKIFNKYKNGTI